MARGFVLAMLGILIFVMGFVIGGVADERSAFHPEDVVAIRWGTAASGMEDYGAMVYVLGNKVRLRMAQFDMQNSVDFGILAEDGFNARNKFNDIEFRKDGLHIGSYFLSKAAIAAKL